MLRTISLLALVVLTASGCARVSESRFNPLNWWGSSEPTQIDPATGQPVIDRSNIRPLVPASRVRQTVDARPLVAEVTQLEITPTIGGVIVRASGRAATAGTYSAELTLREASNEGLFLDLRAFQQTGAGAGNVTVARFVSDADLGGARTITVRGQTNSLSRRR
ncbi:MAG: hypothetical protein AAFP28_08935 [Pseudomonadota bacterium]